MELYLRTGTPIHPMSPVTKLMWMRHELPSLFSQAAKFISIKEYVYFKLFGQYVVDHSIASSTGMMNLEALAWDPQALELAGITEDHLSTIVPTTHIMEGLKASMPQPWGSPLPLRSCSALPTEFCRTWCERHPAWRRCGDDRHERRHPYGRRQADDRSERTHFLLCLNGEALGHWRRGQ